MKFNYIVSKVTSNGQTVDLTGPYSHGQHGSIQVTNLDADQLSWFGARINKLVTLTIEDPDA